MAKSALYKNKSRRRLTNAEREEISKDFISYCKYMVPLFEGKYEYEWFHYFVANKLDHYVNIGKGNLVMEGPPQHFKTIMAGKLLISYFMALYPDKSVIYATYNNDRAKAFTKELYSQILFNEKYQALFPWMKFKYNLDEEENTIENKQKRKSAVLGDDIFTIIGYRGQYHAVGVGQGVSGYPGHLIVVDDYFGSYNDAQSQINRDKVNNWYKADIRGRAQGDTLFVTFCTRWHEEDAIGMIRKEAEDNTDPNYIVPEFITIPAQKEEWHDLPYDPRQPGEYLWNIHLSKYAAAKKDDIIWNCVYQQNPKNVSNMFFKPEYLIEYTEPRQARNVYISIDCNLRADANTKDKTSITVWEPYNNEHYLIDIYSFKTDFIDLVENVKNVINKYPYYLAVLIEVTGGSNGQAVYDTLIRQYFSRIIPVKAAKSKVERAQLVKPEYSAGHIRIPKFHPLVQEFKREHLNFTGAPKGVDDHVDTTTQYLWWKINNTIIRRDGITDCIQVGSSTSKFVLDVINTDDNYYNQIIDESALNYELAQLCA